MNVSKKDLEERIIRNSLFFYILKNLKSGDNINRWLKKIKEKNNEILKKEIIEYLSDGTKEKNKIIEDEINEMIEEKLKWIDEYFER